MKSRYTRGVLVEGRLDDRGMDDAMEIYGSGVLFFINGILLYKSGLSDSNTIYRPIIKYLVKLRLQRKYKLQPGSKISKKNELFHFQSWRAETVWDKVLKDSE